MGEARDSYLNAKKERAFKQLRLCKEVGATLKTRGWIEVIEPMIDKMIIDIVGGKVGGRWVSGAVSAAKQTEKKDFLLGNKQFGIDLLNRIYNFVDNIERKESDIVGYDKELNAPYVTPMMENPSLILDSGYGGKRKNTLYNKSTVDTPLKVITPKKTKTRKKRKKK